MNKGTMTLGSLFDGSGGFPLGGLLCGIKPVWASEIEPFPIRVTTKRIPGMKHLGDISRLKGSEIEPVDIITFGSPCQDMSIAGKREGLDGERSGLFHEAIRLVKEMREATCGEYPRYLVWENVPGAFSSNKGSDFRAVIQEIVDVRYNGKVYVPQPEKWYSSGLIVEDDFSLAWRVLDAQYWGVPQRRKRIYLVADLAGGSAGEILFESEGLPGNPQEGIFKRKAAAGGTPEGIGATEPDGILNIENHPNDSRIKIADDGKCQTLSTRMGTGGGNVPLVGEAEPMLLKIRCGKEGGGKGPLVQKNRSATISCNNDQTLFAPKVYGIGSKDSNAMKSDNPRSGIYEAQTSRTLDANGGSPCCNQGGMAIVEPVEIFDVRFTSEGTKNARGHCYKTDVSRCLDSGESNPDSNHGGIAVLEGNGSRPSHLGDGYKESDVMYTLNATEHHAVAYGIGRTVFCQAYNSLFSFPIDEEIAQTIISSGPGAVAVPAYGIDRAAFNQGANAKFGISIEEEKEPAIVARGPNAVADPHYSSSKASFFTNALKEQTGTLVATDYKDPPIVNDSDEVKYIVRRLTPTECARLQGFPDWWTSGLGTENPSEEDITFWREVFLTHARVMGKREKPKTDSQIIKWLKEPNTDAAEYKMWGNGVALPCVMQVMFGIRFYAEMESKTNV